MIKLTKYLILLIACVVGSIGVAQDPYNGHYFEEVTIDPSVASDIEAATGITPRTWRLYVCMNAPNFELQAIFGTSIYPWTINSTSNFYQAYPNSNFVAAGVNSAFFSIFPEGEYDSWFTLGATYSSSAETAEAPGFEPSQIFEGWSGSPLSPPSNSDFHGTGFTVNDPVGSSVFGAWGDGLSQGQPDADNKVLVAQFTVASNAVVSGTMNYQFRQLNPDGTIFLPINYVQSTGRAFTNAPGGGNDSPCPIVFLPLTLTHFTAFPREERVALQWSTESENQVDHFVIERSKDGLNFEKVGTLTATGNTSSTTHYFFDDESPLPGHSYYRLQIVDTNGSVDMSDMRRVEFFGNPATIYPNPTQGTLRIAGLHETVDRIRMTNHLGQLVRDWRVDQAAASMEEDLSELPNGVYLVEMYNGEYRVQTESVIVNR